MGTKLTVEIDMDERVRTTPDGGGGPDEEDEKLGVEGGRGLLLGKLMELLCEWDEREEK